MKYMAKYFQKFNTWMSDDFVKPIQKQCQQTLNTDELCSINTIKDNPKVFENTTSRVDIISKGFFQSEAQKALQNSQVEKAFEIAEQYIQRSERKFYRFLDTETKKIIISKQLSRFDAGYVSSAKQKLKGLQKIGYGHDILHITLTISHAENSNYIEKYKLLKSKFYDFICFFRRVMKKKNRLCFNIRGYAGKRRAISSAHSSYSDRGWISSEKNDSHLICKMENISK